MPIHSDPTKMEEGELIYALDIGTRSVIGMLGALEQGRIRILALEKQPTPDVPCWTVRSRILTRLPALSPL